ncbi:hypothetical protein BCV69DRAFT_128599 [Microstroma glucosiphilum]|uniref:Uncharacterized protein n=1 Tax=Pseudomicrostroma glucosiphilum TaxID=1684307 RepID=A0A316TYE5_9BASI|nr:hypothetical protein BCV69DRAFT_128599 [Pseudomicrostroma glucosiphilum]PWN17744.1 hypothetical protein BCV69DRAFT_128599 [Pseudomicrostroma glucosiphilum]
MATITLSQRQVGLDTEAPGPAPAPHYTFHFPQAPPPIHRKKGTPPDFVPAAILRETVAPAGEHQQEGSSGQARTRSGTLPTGPSLASRGTRSEGAKAIEAEIYADGLGRWYPTHYAMDTSQEVHRSAEDIVASPQVSDIFKRFNEAVKARLAETALVTIIRELGAEVRSQLHRQHLEGDLPPPTHPDYGGFVQMENVRMDKLDSTVATPWMLSC